MALVTSAWADELSAGDYAKRCLERYQAGQYSLAVAECDEMARLAPSNADAWNMACFARAISHNGDLHKAIEDCDKSLRLDPGNVNTLDSRGLAHLKAGNLEKAIADYDAALARNNKLASSLYGRGLAKLKKGDSNGNGDIAAATAIEMDIAKQFASYGIEQMPPPRDPVAAAAASSDPCALAAMHWQSTESIHTLSAYRDHLARFPTCTFADLARARIAALSKPEPAPKAAAAKPPRAKARSTSARSASAPAAAERPSGELNCSSPAQWAACANRALSTVPGSN